MFFDTRLLVSKSILNVYEILRKDYTHCTRLNCPQRVVLAGKGCTRPTMKCDNVVPADIFPPKLCFSLGRIAASAANSRPTTTTMLRSSARDRHEGGGHRKRVIVTSSKTTDTYESIWGQWSKPLNFEFLTFLIPRGLLMRLENLYFDCKSLNWK